MDRTSFRLDRPFRGPQWDRSAGVSIPPDRMPLLDHWQLRKSWHYVTFWSPTLSLCAAVARVGFLRQEYWAVWDRTGERLWTNAHFWFRRVRLQEGRVLVEDGDVGIDLSFTPTDAFEVYRPEGRAYIWSHKELGADAAARVRLDNRTLDVQGSAFVDINAGYHGRHTRWRWAAGAGVDVEGRKVAWNAIVGLFDSPEQSERTVWLEGKGWEIRPVRFSDDIRTVFFDEGGELRFRPETALKMRRNFIVVRSRYDHSFGRYSGTLPEGIELAEGFGVRERQDAVW